MKKVLLFLSLCVYRQLSAQIPEDALRASWTTPSGTAREQAIGGAMGSLGGEISSGFVNPAGLGLYRTSEFVITPGLHFLMDRSGYRGADASGNTVSNFNLGTSGLVLGYPNNKGTNNVFSVAVNRTATFNSNVYYKGQNNYSSFAEQYAEDFAASGLGIDEAIASPGLSYGTRMALYTYLIDTATINGTTQVIAQPQKAGLLNQENNLRTKGGITEVAFSLATNFHQKWFIGGTLGIPILSYTRNQTYYESDATGNSNNDFDYFTYQETYTTKGFGFNGKLGVLFQPVPAWRIGLAVHTPTVFGLTDNINASMVANTENYTAQHTISINSDSLDALTGVNSANSINYNLYTPWKFLVSAAYVFGSGQADTRQQRGFLTGDLEYVTTSSPRYQSADNNDGANNYFDQVNQAIKASYKGSLGLRLGGEMKFNTLMARAGFSYYSTPYKDNALKADKMFLSAGTGYRNGGLFIDLTYVMGFSRDVNFPYTLTDKANTFAFLKETAGTVLMTVGFKF